MLDLNKRKRHIMCVVSASSHPRARCPRRHYILIIASSGHRPIVQTRHLYCIKITNILLFVNISVSPDISKSNLSFTNYRALVEVDGLIP